MRRALICITARSGVGGLYVELSCPSEAAVSVLFAAVIDICRRASLLYVGTHFCVY